MLILPNALLFSQNDHVHYKFGTFEAFESLADWNRQDKVPTIVHLSHKLHHLVFHPSLIVPCRKFAMISPFCYVDRVNLNLEPVIVIHALIIGCGTPRLWRLSC